MSPNLAGALLMIAASAAFTLNDTMVKLTDSALPVFQLIFLRGLLTTLMLYGLAKGVRALVWPVALRDRALIVLRGLVEAGGAYFLLSALLHMPLANLTVLLQAVPLTVTLASAVLLRESVGWRRGSSWRRGFHALSRTPDDACAANAIFRRVRTPAARYRRRWRTGCGTAFPLSHSGV